MSERTINQGIGAASLAYYRGEVRKIRDRAPKVQDLQTYCAILDLAELLDVLIGHLAAILPEPSEGAHE